MSKTILLADDSVTIRKVVELTFMEEDFELVSLGGGEQALERLPQLNPDLVIADVHMPGVTGYDVCRAAKEQRPERPVLLLVGTFEPFDADELAASGADAHLKKPFDSQELLQTVRDLLAGASGAGEPRAETGFEAAFPEAGPEGSEPVGSEAATAVMPLGELELPAAASAAGFDAPAGEAAEEGPPADAEAEEEEAELAAPLEAPETAVGNGNAELSDEAVERIARRVAELLGPEAVREVAWEVVPDLAEVVIKERLRELEKQVD